MTVPGNEEILLKSERRRRLRMIMSVLPGIIGIALVMYRILTPNEYFPFSPSFFPVLATSLIGVSAIYIVMMYLQTGFQQTRKLRDNNYETYELYQNTFESYAGDLEELFNNKFNLLKEEVAEFKSTAKENIVSTALSQSEKDDLLSKIKESLEQESATNILNELKEKITQDHKKNIRFSEINKHFRESFARLNQELASLGRRGNLNLSLGIVTTITGLGILGFYVFQQNSPSNDPLQFTIHFVPRLSLVIFIEVFAYFFLRLYKSSLAEIKYFQNEITNLESKFVAIKESIASENSDISAKVISCLANTERNHILEKGQTTVELEKSKIENETISTLSSKLNETIKSLKK